MLIDLFFTFAFAMLAVFIYMNIWFIAALVKSNNGVADIAWGPGFILVALFSYILNRPDGVRPLLLAVLVVLWGVRLATHIYLRNRGRGEDPRYAAWRAEWGNNFLIRTFLQVFMLQGFLLLVISLPVMAIETQGGGPLRVLDYLGLALWILGFLFESVGDFQLARFLKDPGNKGKIMTRGLWAFTRHPNYFGEVTLWWGIWLIALSGGAGLWTIIGPLVITYLILGVSGIPMTERRYLGNAEFEQYKARTSAFIPWFPKRG